MENNPRLTSLLECQTFYNCEKMTVYEDGSLKSGSQGYIQVLINVLKLTEKSVDL